MTTSISVQEGTDACNTIGCDNCAVGDLCARYSDNQNKEHEAVLQHYHPLNDSGSHIFWEGDKFDLLYAVKSGCIKTYTLDEDGNERIRGFYLPGDLVALDALYSDEYTSSACAVVPTQVCGIPYSQLTRVVASKPELQQRLLKMMSKDLSTALALAGDYSAEQRMAAFLLHLYEREQQRHIGKNGEIELLMPRRDIASFLRLAPETASRVLSRFQQQGMIRSRQRCLQLNDPQALWALAQPLGITSTPCENRRAA